MGYRGQVCFQELSSVVPTMLNWRFTGTPLGRNHYEGCLGGMAEQHCVSAPGGVSPGGAVGQDTDDRWGMPSAELGRCSARWLTNTVVGEGMFATRVLALSTPPGTSRWPHRQLRNDRGKQ